MARQAALLAGAGLALGAGALVTIGPGAAPLIDWLADGREIGPLGVISLDGVSGWHIGDLRFARATLSDADGVYADLRDGAVRWSVLSAVFGAFDIESASAASLDILRRPALARSPHASEDVNMRVRDARIANVRARNSVFGFALDATVAGSVDLRADGLHAAEFVATQRSGDRVQVRAQNRGDVETPFSAQALILRDGPLMGALGLNADATLDVAGTFGARDASSGQATLKATLDGVRVADMTARWTPELQSITGEARLTEAASLRAAAQRLGPVVALRATRKAEDLTVEAQSDRLAVTLSGAAPTLSLDGPLNVQVRAPSLRLLAPDAGLSGALAWEGQATLTPSGARAEGVVNSADFGVGSVRAALNGPLTLTWDGAVVALEGRAAIADVRGDGAALLEGAVLDASLRYDPQSNTVASLNAGFQAPAGDVQMRGAGDQMAGQWRVKSIAAFAPGVRGAGAGDFEWRDNALSLSGAIADLSLPDAASGLHDGAARFSGRVRATQAGWRLDVGRLETSRARLGMAGSLGKNLDLTVEASVRGPVAAGGLEVDGVFNGRARVQGAWRAPVVRGALIADKASTPLGEIDDAVVQIDFTNGRGQMSVSGASEQGPVDLSGRYAFENDGLRVEQVRGQAFGFAVDAQAFTSPTKTNASGSLRGELGALIGGADGVVVAEFAVDDERMRATATLGAGQFGELRWNDANATIAGSADAFDWRMTWSAQAGAAPVTLTAEGDLITSDGIEATAHLNGQIGDVAISTRETLTFSAKRQMLSASGRMGIGTGSVSFDLARGQNAASIDVDVDAAPLGPLLALMGETGDGLVTGKARWRATSAGLEGEADLRATNIVARKRAPEPVDLDLDVVLSGDVAKTTLALRTASGLAVEARSTAPLGPALGGVVPTLRADAPLSIAWEATGPAAPLWLAFGPLDQRLEGAFQSTGAIDWTPGGAAVGTGLARLSGGAFEDKALGVRLQDLEALLALDEAGLRLQSLSAQDGDGGRLSGAGQFRAGATASAGEGDTRLRLDGLRILDRADLSAVATGDLDLIIDQDGVLARGTLRIDALEAAPPAPSNPLALLAVREVNRPSGFSEPTLATATAAPIRLDVRLEAPGRLFVRGRGLQSEWSADVVARGPLSAPSLIGEARLLRGDFRLAGRAFDLSEGRLQFAGAPTDADVTIVAERAAPDLTAQIRVAGTVAAPEITLTSTPGLPADEILPRVLFGRAGVDLSPLEAAQIGASLAALSGQSAFDLAGTARSLVQLDRLDVRSTEAGFTMAGGKYLSPDVYLELGRSSLGTADATVEWRLRPEFLLISTFESLGDARVSIRWRQEQGE